MQTTIRKAIFPVAGLGTRFLPATKASPKEMLTIVDKPLIQYAVEEAAAAGITEIIFVTGRHKRAIEDHFDRACELEAELAAKEKDVLLNMVRAVKPANVECIYIRQSALMGLGHAVLCAERVMQDEAFAVIVADDLIDAATPPLAQMVATFEQYRASVIGGAHIEPGPTGLYRGLDPAELLSDSLAVLRAIAPESAELAPGQLGVAGRYILTPSIFRHLRDTPAAPDGEIRLADAIDLQARHERVIAQRIEGAHYDCGCKLGYLKANVVFGLKHPDLREGLLDYVRNMNLA